MLLYIRKRIRLVNRIFVYSLLLRAVSLLIGIFLIRMQIDIWGSDIYTLYVVFSSTIAWYGLFDFGAATKLRNELNELSLYDEKSAYNTIITEAFINAIRKIILIAVVLLPIHYFFFSTCKTTASIGMSMNSLNFFFIFLSFAFQFLTNYLTSIFYGLRNFLLPSVVSIVSNLIYIFFLLLIKENFFGDSGGGFFFLLFFFIGFLPFLISCGLFYKTHSFLYIGFRTFAKSLVSIKIFANIEKTFFFQNAESLLINQLAPLIIVLMTSNESVLTYSLTSRLFVIPTIFFSIVNNIYWSIWSDLNYRKDVKGIIRNYGYIFFLLFGYLVYSFVFIKYNKSILSFLFNVGVSNLNAYISFLFALLYFIYIWNNIFEVFFNSINKNEYLKYSSAINIIIFIGFCLFGEVSSLDEFLTALIASSISTLLLTLYLVFKYFRIDHVKYMQNEI